MLQLFQTAEKAFGVIGQDDYDKLSPRLRVQIEQSAFKAKRTKDRIDIEFLNHEVAEACYQAIRVWERGRERTERRRRSEDFESGGVCRPEDIEAIFILQEGRCYFTGKPLLRYPKNYALDHLTPVSQGGSFWPANLALVRKEVNHQKHGRTRLAYLNLLQREHGLAWGEARKAKCKEIDQKRRTIDLHRKSIVRNRIQAIAQALNTQYHQEFVIFELKDDRLTLGVNGVGVAFSKGFVRQIDRSDVVRYLSGVVDAILLKPVNRKVSVNR